MFKKFFSVLLALFLLLPGQAVSAQEADSLFNRALRKEPYSVLDGRLTIRIPAGTEDAAMQPDIMGPMSSSARETRLMSENIGGAELVVYAQEMFCYSTGDFVKDLEIIFSSNWEDAEFGYELACSEPGFSAAKLKIPATDPQGEAILVSAVVVRTADNGLIMLSFLVTPEAYRFPDQCRALCDRVIATLKPGERMLNTDARRETLDAAGYQISLDKDYVVIEQFGVDFLVYYIDKVTPLGTSAPSMGIYLGFHPSTDGKPYGTQSKGAILGKSVVWSASGNRVETLTTLKGGNMMHIFITADDQADRAALKKMAQSLQVKTK